MSTRSVIDVDVNTSKFEKFQQIFNKYSSALAKAPAEWKAVGKEQAAIGSHFERGVAALREQAELALEELKSREAEEKALGKSEQHWRSIASSSKSVSAASKSMGASIASASTSMLKWSGVLGGVAGALSTVMTVATVGFEAALAIYNKSAAVAGNLGSERRTAQGLGMGIGEHRAFGLDLSRITDTDSFLGNVEEMMTDPSKSGPLWRAGINPNGSTTQVATSYMDWARKQAVATQPGQLGLLNQRWGSQIPIDTWMRLHNMSADEYGDDRKQFENDRSEKGGLGINDRAARRAQDFGVQVERADLQGNNIWERKVAERSGRLTDVSKGFVDLQRTIAGTKTFDWAMGKMDEGLKWVATKGIPDLIKGVKDIDEGLGKLNKTLEKWDKAWKDKLNPQGVGERGRKWFDDHIMGKKDGRKVSSSAPGLPPPFLRKRHSEASDPNDPTNGVPKLLDLGHIVGSDPTSWNPTPISNTYANRNSVSNTTNNYGSRGGGAGGTVSVVISAPPGFSATTTLAGLNAGLA